MFMMQNGKSIYRLDEVGKVILKGLQQSGRTKTFAQILDEAGYHYDNTRQVEVAISLEALELIKNVTYQLPLEIHAELSTLGNEVVEALKRVRTNKVKDFIDNARRRLRSDFKPSYNS